MNDQETYEKVVKALALQGRQSSLSSGSCLYRHPEGLKCAAGILIEDDEYGDWMEKRTIFSVLKDDRCPESLKNRLIKQSTLVDQLQVNHDLSETWIDQVTFKHSFRDVGKWANLDDAFIDNLEFGGDLAKTD